VKGRGCCLNLRFSAYDVPRNVPISEIIFLAAIKQLRSAVSLWSNKNHGSFLSSLIFFCIIIMSALQALLWVHYNNWQINQTRLWVEAWLEAKWQSRILLFTTRLSRWGIQSKASWKISWYVVISFLSFKCRQLCKSRLGMKYKKLEEIVCFFSFIFLSHNKLFIQMYCYLR